MNRKIPQVNTQVYDDDEIDLIELWNTIWRKRKFITYFTGTAVLLTVIISLFISNKYKAESTLLPVASGGGIMGDLAGMAALAGINVGGSSDNTAKVMVVANSRTVKEQVINELGLIKIIGEDIPAKRDPMQYTTEMFNKLLTVVSDKKTGVITIGFEWEDPELSAKIVNSYVQALQDVLETKALSIDKMQRVFFEKKLKEERAKFSGKKHELAAFQIGRASCRERV